MDRNTLPAEVAASASAARVQESTTGVVRTYGRTLEALVTQLEAVVLTGSLDERGAQAVQHAVQAGKTVALRLVDVQQHMSSQASMSALATCRAELAEHTCIQLEEQLEGMQLQVEKCRLAISADAVTSKERTRYRSKGADLKAQVGKIVEQYNICILHGRTRRRPAEVDAILSGEFPWIAEGKLITFCFQLVSRSVWLICRAMQHLLVLHLPNGSPHEIQACNLPEPMGIVTKGAWKPEAGLLCR